MVLLFRDGVVHPLCKDSILFFAILRKPCGSGISIVLDKSDRMLILAIFSFYLKLNMSLSHIFGIFQIFYSHLVLV